VTALVHVLLKPRPPELAIGTPSLSRGPSPKGVPHTGITHRTMRHHDMTERGSRRMSSSAPVPQLRPELSRRPSPTPPCGLPTASNPAGACSGERRPIALISSAGHASETAACRGRRSSSPGRGGRQQRWPRPVFSPTARQGVGVPPSRVHPASIPRPPPTAQYRPVPLRPPDQDKRSLADTDGHWRILVYPPEKREVTGSTPVPTTLSPTRFGRPRRSGRRGRRPRSGRR
jgi:hypothetical protein